MDTNELTQWLLNFAFSHGIGYTLTGELPPDVPSCAIPARQAIIINTNYEKKEHIPFIIAHEIGHVLNGDSGTCYYSTYSARSKYEAAANRFAIDLIRRYAESKGDSSCSYIKFAETWCIPSDLYENVKEEFNRYWEKTGRWL